MTSDPRVLHRNQWCYWTIITVFTLIAVTAPTLAARNEGPSRYPKDAEELFAIARDLWAPVELQSLDFIDFGLDEEASSYRIHMAALMLETAHELDSSNTEVMRDLMTLYISDVIDDPGRAAQMLAQYSNRIPDDEELIRSYVRYRYNRLPDSYTREYYLNVQLQGLSEYPAVQSAFTMRLGELAFAKGELEVARGLFEKAFLINQYNDKALARFLALPDPTGFEGMDDSDQTMLEDMSTRQKMHVYSAFRWRIRLHNNPFDLQATINLIEVLDRLGLYDLSARFYEHGFTLLESHPDPETLEQELRVNRLVSTYSSGQYQECIPLAQHALQEDPNDLLINGILAKTLENLGLTDESQQLMQDISALADDIQRFSAGQGYEQLLERAWFYSFVMQDAEKAMEAAEFAHDVEPADSRAMALLAYAHTLHFNYERANELIGQIPPSDQEDNPIVNLAQARVAFARGQVARARETLLAAAVSPSPIVSETIQRLVDEIESRTDVSDEQQSQREQLSPLQLMNETLRQEFRNRFNNNDLDMVTDPESFVRLSLRLPSDVFYYGDPILAELYLSNVSDKLDGHTLVLGEDQAIDPHVLILAEIRPSFLYSQVRPKSEKAPPVIRIPLAYRYLNQLSILEPGRSNVIHEALNIGLLRDFLNAHPQMEYKVSFRLLLDPVDMGDGEYVSRIERLQPPDHIITRKAFQPNTERMDYNFRKIRTGKPMERIRATRVLGGLLREAYLHRTDQLSYIPRPVDTRSIRNAIVDNLSHRDHRVRAWSAYALRRIPPMDEQEREKLSQLLNDENWLARFMAINSLVSSTDLSEYLRWAEAIETHPIVKRQVKFLNGTDWEIIDMPVNPPKQREEQDRPLY